MTNTDIEEVATNIIKEQISRNRDCLRPFINDNDKTPFWDGNIYIYNKSTKTNEDFEGKIDVQVKGRHVTHYKDKNTFQIPVTTLKGFQKEVKGTLLFVVDFKNDDDYRIYYCNLLPVDLYEILQKIRDDQETFSLNLKMINNGALSFKNVCLNFFKNSNKQAGKRIIDKSEFSKIEELKFEIIAKQDEYEEYMEIADVYTYATLKGTHEEVVTIKGKWTSFSNIRKNVCINNKKYYSEYKVFGSNRDIIVVGPITIYLNDNKLHIDICGTPKQRIKDLNFILDLFKYQYITFDDVKLEFPFNNLDKINKNKELFYKQLKYYEKIVQVFKFFNTDFDIEFENLSKEDLTKLHRLMSMFDGNFGDELSELQKYYIKINKFKFIFVPVKNKNKLYNFYSQEMINNTICFLPNNGKKIKTSIFVNLTPEELIDVSNFNEKIIVKSFKNIELNDIVFDSINSLILTFINTYDKTNNKTFLSVADKLSQINCKNRNSDIDIINSKQIKYRKKSLSTNDKKILNNISQNKKYKNDYVLLACIDILLKNKFNYEEHYRLMKSKDRNLLKQFPIYNLIEGDLK